MTSALAGKPPPPELLVDVPALVTAYYTERPDPSAAAERVAFGTSGHRGSSLHRSFNEWHILAVTQAICAHRTRAGVTGPLFLAMDTHALSVPAFCSALEVLAANGVDVRIAGAAERWTPTPALSHAILCHNRGRTSGLADGIVVTPSHNPPEDGGFKYNPPSGGPADADATAAIERHANEMLAAELRDVRRIPYARARRAGTTREHDFLGAYVADLENVVDLAAIRDVRLRVGVDPLGGAGVRYWSAIAERHRLDLTVVSDVVDPTFRFMTVDWDGRIRMDPSSPYAMQRLLGLRNRFDVAFGCDTDHDRHGIVTRSAGLLPPNHFLVVCIDHLFRTRPGWRPDAAVGKTMVSSSLIDRVAARVGRRVEEGPVGFKWFVDGLLDGRLGFAGEESAGATFLRRDGTAWTTDKDAIVPSLLAAEITAATGRDPGEAYAALAAELGAPAYTRVDAPATAAQKAVLKQLTAAQLGLAELGGDPVEQALTHAPGNRAPLGVLKVITAQAWFAARPSGTEEVYKLYAESFRGEAHLREVLAEAQAAVSRAFAAAGA